MAPVENLVSAVRTRIPSPLAEAEAGTGAPQVPAGGAGLALLLTPPAPQEGEAGQLPPGGRGQGSLQATRGEVTAPHEEGEARQPLGHRQRTRMAPWEPAVGALTASSQRGSLHETQSHQQLLQQQDDRSQRGSLLGAQSQQQLSQQQQQDDRARALEARLEAAEQLLHLMAQRQLAAQAGPSHAVGLTLPPHREGTAEQNALGMVAEQRDVGEERRGMGVREAALTVGHTQSLLAPLMPPGEGHLCPAGSGARFSAPDESRPPQPAPPPLHSNHNPWSLDNNVGTRSGGSGGHQQAEAHAPPRRGNNVSSGSGNSGSTRQPVAAIPSPAVPRPPSSSVAVPLRDRLRRLADRIVGRRGRD